jgi:hypothetical protein
VLYCMNLPYSIRFKLENICIIAMTPIPNTPDPYTISHIIQIITDMISPFSTPEGKKLPTYKQPQGAFVECYLIPIIADLQAIRKWCGFMSHSATMFCWFCLCTKTEIERLDFEAWTLRDGTTVRTQAEEWQNLDTTSAKEAFSKKTGVRWTPMQLLWYWNPVSHTLLGFMHNWLEGILQHQLRSLYGIGRSKKLADSLSLDSDLRDEQLMDSDISDSSSELSGLEQEQQEFFLHHHYNDMDIDDNSSDTSLTTPVPQSQYYLSDDDDTETIHDPDFTPNDNFPPLFLFSDTQLLEIRNAVKEIILPTWVARLPENLGEESHGKLKAQEYLSLFTIILPLVLPELWSDEDSHHLRLLESFHHLVSATNIIASFTTSNTMADKYTYHYTLYRQSIQELFPQFPSKPNHHYAMHNGDLLKFWGPLTKLSEFAGERTNGMMQRTKTSRRKCEYFYTCIILCWNFSQQLIGDMDFTMIRQMCRRANLIVISQNESAEPAVTDLFQVLQPTQQSTTPSSTGLDDEQLASFLMKGQHIEDPIHNAILRYLKSLGQPWHSYSEFPPHPDPDWILPPRANMPSQIVIQDRTYSCSVSHLGNSAIMFYNPVGDTTIKHTGIIDTICQLPLHGFLQTFFIVHLHQNLPPNLETILPYQKYPGLNSKLVESIPGDISLVIEPHHIITHLVMYKRPSGTYNIPRETLALCWSLDRGRR